jgi:hypothetical protein
VMYLHALANTTTGSVFCKIYTRLLSEEEREEIGRATGSASQSNIRKQRQAKKRGRYGAQQQSKVRVRGLEGLGIGMISIFQSKHLEMAESHAENVRAIFYAIRDVIPCCPHLRII